MLAANRLPQFYHPVFTSRRFLRVTSDRFFLVIEAKDPRFDLDRTRELLSDAGGAHVEEVRG